jgi:hypothetical protein
MNGSIKHVHRFRGAGNKDGVALLMVVLVITGLIIIATPFLISMRLQEKVSKSIAWKVRAKHVARGALRHAVNVLCDTHEDTERLNFFNNTSGTFNTIDYDDGSELTVTFDDVSRDANFHMANSSGTIWDARIEDENGKININSAPPLLISNLLGVSVLAESINAMDSTIPLEDTTPFYTDRNAETVDGFVRIDGEFIAYTGKTAEALIGCRRGLFLIPPSRHEAGALVNDGRGWKIAEHRALRNPGSLMRPGRLTPFETIDSIREVSSWTKFSRQWENLRRHGFYLDKLDEYGVTEDDLEDLDIDPAKLERPEYEEPEPDPQEKEWARQVSKAGFDADFIRKNYGGSGALRRLAGFIGHINKVSDKKQLNIAKKQLDAMRKRHDEHKKRREEHEAMLKKYIPETIEELKALRDRLQTLIAFETIDAAKLASFRSFITTTSWRPAEWARRVRLRADVPRTNPKNEEDWRILPVYGDWFNPGTTVWIRSSGTVEYGLIERRGRGGLLLSADVRHHFDSDDTWVSAMYRHPVNINTAPREVLRAVLTGLEVSRWSRGRTRARGTANARDFVTPREACALVEYLRSTDRVIGNIEELEMFLDEAVELGNISERDRTAIMTNAVNPNSPLLMQSTTGFTYRTHNIYTVTATGIVNSPVGDKVASHTIRQIVEVTPPRVVRLVMDSQEDLSAGITTGGTVEYPQRVAFAGRRQNKLSTMPNSTNPDSAGFWRFPSQDHLPDSGDMRITTLRSKAPSGTVYAMHWDDTLDGTDACSFSSDTPRFLPTTSVVPTGGNANQPTAVTALSIRPGMFETWFRLNGNAGGRRFFFDMGEDEFVNRVAFYLDSGQLVLQVSDATLDQEAAVLRGSPARPLDPNVWYHVSAAWKGVRYGDLSVTVDGKSVGQYQGFTRLATAIDDKTYNIPVEDASALPAAGVAQIDNEVVEYITRGNYLCIPNIPDPPPPGSPPLPPGMVPPNKRVAARGTTPSPHDTGTIVTVFGYSNPLNEELIVGGARTIYSLPDHTPMCRLLTLGNDAFISANATDIPADDTSEFPQDGIIKIDNENIYYPSIETIANVSTFKDCVRGIEGTTATMHGNMSTIRLVSLKVTDTSDYHNSGHIQLDDEWLDYDKANDADYRANYFIIESGRAWGYTIPAAHAGGTKVIPIFQLANRWSGADDMVTIIDTAGKEPRLRRINHSYMNYAALDDWVGRHYLSGADGLGRILKWPSGELPSEINATTRVGTGRTGAGVLSSRIDELITAADSLVSTSYYLILDRAGPISRADATVVLTSEPSGARGGLIIPGRSVGSTVHPRVLNSLFRRARLIKIDDEIIGVGDCAQTETGVTLQGCLRGLLGTQSAAHPGGSRVYIVPYPKVGKLLGGISNDPDISIQVSTGDVPREGYFQVAPMHGQRKDRGEIVPYRRAGGRAFRRHVDINNTPCFRAAFGSPATGSASGDLAVFLPVRYWDLYRAQCDSIQGVIFQTSHTVRSAYWRRITWNEQNVHLTDVVVLVRLDGKPDWASQPTNQPDGLYYFNDPTAENTINREADLIEIRVFFTYPRDAYQTDIWKTTPVVGSVDVEYTRPPVVHYTEVLEE